MIRKPEKAIAISDRTERDRFLKIEKGVVVGCQVRQNSLAEEGHGPRWQMADK
jgi:hypothetical protein